MKLSVGYYAITTILHIFVMLFFINQIFSSQISDYSKHAKLKQIVNEDYRKLKENYYFSKSCTKPKKKIEKIQHLTRHPRAVRRRWGDVAKSGKAFYFSGVEILKLKTGRRFSSVEIPNEQFTVEVWIKPEGGQFDPVTILGLKDVCSMESVWELGIKSQTDDESTATYYFSLKTGSSAHRTEILSHLSYIPDKWTFVAVTYNERSLRLYINNAMVAVSDDQRGRLFEPATRRCKSIHLGGDSSSGFSFRGAVDDLRIWNKCLEHENISQSYKTVLNSDLNVIFQDNFQNTKRWRKLSRYLPELVESDISDSTEHVLVKAPPCGETICDDPTLVKSYLNNDQLRTQKEIRYRIINLMNDDGSSPVVNRKQIQTQHRALVKAFSPYNITWDLRQDNIQNTTLRQKSILMVCDPSNVGDGVCQHECQHSQTGNDGGDCEPFINNCLRENIGNGRCDFECNKEYHLWDRGDCCEPGPHVNLTCFDPRSPYRNYLGINELREAIGLDSASYLNVFVIPNTIDRLSALATLPWDKHVFGVQGGIVIRAEEFGSPEHSVNLVHEIGHVFGLYHVHHGVSEMECDNPCLETHASMELGDLCSDTEPTPNNTYCRDPDGSQSTCGISAFHNTPFRNYMSYADGDCLDNFSPQQVARMHCYLDLVYQPWSTAKHPTPVPLKPRALWVDIQSVKLVWLPPLGSPSMSMTSFCDVCDDAMSASQFAVSSNSSHPGDMTYNYKSHEAEGPPDAEPCAVSIRSWMPDAEGYDCGMRGCQLELGFRYPVVPSKLTIWVNFNFFGTIDNIVLLFTDGSSQDLGLFPTMCSTPLTIPLSVTERVSGIRIHTSHPAVAIDAVELSTNEMYADCLRCRSRKYKILRDPPFNIGAMKQTSEPVLVDSEVLEGQSYNYTVIVSMGARESELSPVLQYTHGAPICGDGKVNGEPVEECDDGNLSDGDGCSINCLFEDFFHCRGEPSVCYRHNGDGICEEFEVMSSVKDCGYYTPEGYHDKWVSSAIANPSYQGTSCPELNMVGIPDTSRTCQQFPSTGVSWYPCGHNYQPGNFWIEVYFTRHVVATEVIIHMGSVGQMILAYDEPPFIRVELISDTNVSTSLVPERIPISCQKNPIHIKVHHDLSQPFAFTKGVRIRFASYNVSFAGVRLRSSRLLDPVTIATCSEDEVYNPRSGYCVQQNCSVQFCGMVNIPNSHTNCSGHREGDICRISCETGFDLNDTNNEVICINGTWISDTPLSCAPLACGMPEVPHASVACPDRTSFGNTCLFKCNPPSVLEGTETTITCREDGHWSTPESSCLVKCRSPNTIRNAKLMTRICKRGYHSVGKKCRFKCHSGYHVENRKTSKKKLKIICDSNGEWRGGICIRTTCAPIDVVFTGLYTCTNMQFVGSTCTLTCREQKVQRIKCNALGEWSGSFKMCPSIATSGTCNSLSNTNQLMFNCNGNNIGDQCRVACLVPNSNPVLRGRTNTVRGQLVGQMDMDLPVRQIICTALLEWQPDPARLSCVRTCNRKFVTDGWCDGDNNNAQCDWDGGDCCASTSIAGNVFPFPDSCTDQCVCLDPMAEENRRKHIRKRKLKKTRRRKHKKKRLIKDKVNTTVSSTESTTVVGS